MNSHATADFWKLYHKLPESIRQSAQDAFRIFSNDPLHPALTMERLRCVSNYWSVRITRNYRAVGVKAGDDMNWFWIGSHSDFEKKFPV